MIGFNGGLIGITKTPSSSPSNPGIWTLGEQIILEKIAAWPKSFLLDRFTAATAAYSLRNLKNTFTTAVVEVRRSNDSAESTFTSTEVANGTLTAWVGAGNDGFIKTWYDQSGNGNNATQTTTSLQPKIVLAGSLVTHSGKPGISFPGGLVRLNADSLDGRSRLDSYIVKNTSDTEYILFTGGLNGYSFVSQSGGSGSSFENYGTPALFANNSLISTGRNNIYNALNGYKLEVHQNSATNAAAWGYFDIGCYNRSSSADFVGTIQELIFFTTDQSANRLNIENNINAYYAIY
jgi:hypothetical protein